MTEMPGNHFTIDEISQFLNQVNVGILILDGKECIIYANDWFLDAAVLSREDAYNRTLNEVFSGRITGRLSTAINESIRAGRSAFLSPKLNKTLFPLQNSNGTKMLQSIQINPFGNDLEAPRCIVEIENVTDNYEREKILKQKRKEVEAEQAYLNAILQSTAEGIITINGRGEIETFNKAAEKMFDYESKDILGQSVTILIPERFRQAHNDGFRRVSEGGEIKNSDKAMEYYGLRKDGQEFPLELSFSTWSIESEKHFAAFMRDITQRKAVEQKLKESEITFRSSYSIVPDALLITSL